MIALTASRTAIGFGLTSSFLATGGTPPYAYSVQVLPQCAGGTINSASGLYTAPAAANADPNPNFLYDMVQVTDSLAATATLQILVGPSLILFCDIIQKFMGLDPAHVYLWDQKALTPKDYGLYIVVSSENQHVIGNTAEYDPSTGDSLQHVNMYSMLALDLLSRGPAARDNKELVVAALNSTYANQQMETNSFLIGKIPTSFVNLSGLDGSAIPYRFRFNVGFQYSITKRLQNDYFTTIQTTAITTEP